MDCTTRASVKTYLAITTDGQNDLIDALIPRESRLIERYCDRKFGQYVAQTKVLNGTGTGMMTLPETPIISVDAVTLLQPGTPSYAGAQTSALSYDPTGRTAGFTYDDTLIYLNLGARFPRTPQSVQAMWKAGFVGSEVDTVPSAAPYAVQPSDMGRAVVPILVTLNGVTAAGVSGAPLAGQYSLDTDTGTFTFNAADAGKTAVLSYVAIPSPVEQAANEMVGLDLKQRDNLGINSKSLAGESIVYSDQAMTKSTISLLAPYRRLWRG